MPTNTSNIRSIALQAWNQTFAGPGHRELLGSGTLFANAELLLGKSLAFMELTLIPDYRGFLVAVLPPGGFLILGFLLAGKRVLDRQLEARRKAAQAVAMDNAEAV